MGGVFKAAMIGEPPTLDLHTTTAVIVQQITWHVYESALHLRQELQPDPAAGREPHRRRQGADVHLQAPPRREVPQRQGDDVGRRRGLAQAVGPARHAGQAVLEERRGRRGQGPATRSSCTSRSRPGALLMGLARPNNGAVIYPKEIVDAAGDDAGEGVHRHRPLPLRRAQARPPHQARALQGLRRAHRGARRLRRQAHRVPRRDPASSRCPTWPCGWPASRRGEYHYGQQIQQDQYERLKTMPGVVPEHHQALRLVDRRPQPQAGAHDGQAPPPGVPGRARHGADHGGRLRQQGLLPARPRPASSPSSRSGTVGPAAELYNQKNPAKAKKLLKEAGYAGQPVRWITTKEYQWMYKNALVAKQQLEAVGFKVDLQVVDWATLVQRRNKPEVYDVVLDRHHVQSGARASARPSPATGPGWWCHEDKEQWMDGAGARDATRQAQGDVGEGPADLLRGRRAHQVRRLLLARGHRARTCTGFAAHERADALERVAQVSGLRVKTYVARRLLALIPVALVVATVAFVLIHLAPGDPASVIAGPDASARRRAAHRAPARTRRAAAGAAACAGTDGSSRATSASRSSCASR